MLAARGLDADGEAGRQRVEEAGQWEVSLAGKVPAAAGLGLQEVVGGRSRPAGVAELAVGQPPGIEPGDVRRRAAGASEMEGVDQHPAVPLAGRLDQAVRGVDGRDRGVRGELQAHMEPERGRLLAQPREGLGEP